MQEKNLHFITEVKSDRKAFFVNPKTHKGYFANQDELVTLIKTHLWHKVKVIKDSCWSLAVYSFQSRLKSTDFPVKVFVVFGNLNSEDNRNVRTIPRSLCGKGSFNLPATLGN